jgi:hypothetical protein
MSFFYARDYGEQLELGVDEIVEQIRVHPQSDHHVWREGMEDWTEVHQVPEIASRIEDNDELQEPDPDDGYPYRHSIDGKHQPPALAEEIAARVLAAPQATHKVWQDGYLWWPHAQAVPEIAEFGPLPPIPGVRPNPTGLYRMKYEGQQSPEMTAEEVAAKVRENPDGQYLVWQLGMTNWLSPWEIEAIYSLGIGQKPSLDQALWSIALGSWNRGNLTAEQIAEAVRESMDARLRVWRFGMQSWLSPWEIQEIVDLGIGDRPGDEAEETWHYTLGDHRESNLSREQIIERVQKTPSGDHRVWQLGMTRWLSPHEISDFSGLLPELETDQSTRLLLYSRGGKSCGYKSPQEIFQEIKRDPDADHKVWPHMTERWFQPWEVEELIALGVKAPGASVEEIWHYRQNDTNHKNWTARQIALAIMKNPSAEHQVWQFGWQIWEDPRDVPAIVGLLPQEEG